jgi:hypothetical protein
LAIWEALQGQQALMDWFADMLAYARESQPLVAAILTLFGPNGSLHAFPNVPGKGAATLFLHAARVAPSEALTVLERNLGRRTTDELRDFAAGRHEAVHALRIIARDARLFDRAAKLLLRLAEAENQSYSNNATGLFKDLFRLGYGDAASSQLEPTARLPVLLEIAHSPDPVHRGLALGAFDAALHTFGSFGTSVVDHPLQRHADLWTPRTWGEAFDALVTYWDALVSLLSEVAPDEREEWVACLLSGFSRLVQHQAISERVIDGLELALRSGSVPRDGAVRAIDDTLELRENKPDDPTSRRLRNIRAGLVGSGFEVRLKCFVGAGRWFVEGEAAEHEISGFESVVAEAVADPSVLYAHLPWLLSADLGSGFDFGRQLAAKDCEFSIFWSPIAQVLSQNHLTRIGPFPRGYLAGVFGRGPAHWESLLQQLVQSGLPKSRITDLFVGTGMTESVAALVCEWLENGNIDAEILRRLALSTPVSRLPRNELRRCLDALLRRADLAAAVAALETVPFTLERDPAAFDDEVIGRVLLNAPLFQATGRAEGVRYVLEYRWAKLATRWAGDNPNRLAQLAEALLPSFIDDRGIFRGQDETNKLLRRAFSVAPDRSWGLVAPMLTSGDRRLSYRLSIWLRGEDWCGRVGTDEAPPSDLLPQDTILSWVEEDPAQRAPLAAEIAPPVREASKWPSSLVRHLLKRYGARQDVQSALNAGYFTEGWNGPASAHYRGRGSEISLMLQGESDPRARRWLTAIEQELGGLVEGAEIEEERRY